MTNEKTLVLLKPDAVQKKTVGEIVKRFEDKGLKIHGIKMVHPDEKLAREHYPLDEEWAKQTFAKTKKSAEEQNKELEFSNHMDFAKNLQDWLVNFITECPVVGMVLSGPSAISLVREMIGATEPRSALPGTIRGDLASEESYEIADAEKRVLRNLVHASDSPKTAEREIGLWFSDDELHDYD